MNQTSGSSLSSLLPKPKPLSLSAKYAPLNWIPYFNEKITVALLRKPTNQPPDASQKTKLIKFNVYLSSPSDPNKMPIYAFHHGAGSCALSFACLANELNIAFAPGSPTNFSQSNVSLGVGSLSAVVPTDLSGSNNKLSTSSQGSGALFASLCASSPNNLNSLAALQNNTSNYNQTHCDSKTSNNVHYFDPKDLSMPIPGMIPLPGSGLPATVFPGAQLPTTPFLPALQNQPSSSTHTSLPSSFHSPPYHNSQTQHHQQGSPTCNTFSKNSGINNLSRDNRSSFNDPTLFSHTDKQNSETVNTNVDDANKHINIIHTNIMAKNSNSPDSPGVISFDIRYHGETKVYNQILLDDGSTDYVEEPSDEMDMSLDTLALDFVQVVNKVYQIKGWVSNDKQKDCNQTSDSNDTDTEDSIKNKPKKEIINVAKHTIGLQDEPHIDLNEPNSVASLILVGHSLGGSVVTSSAILSSQNQSKNATHSHQDQPYPTFPVPPTGVAVLDVVEGTAVESLSTMDMIIDSRPKSFPSIEKGIEWHLRSKAIRNLESARVSVPSLLKPQPMKNPTPNNNGTTAAAGSSSTFNTNPIAPKGTLISGGRFDWVTDLKATQPFWRNWFTGLSLRFLQVPAARLLVLAGTDRLDKELMIGQMQGKYQLVVFQEAGHFLQEDVPMKCAHLLFDFWKRNDSSKQVIPAFGKFRKDACLK